jgi:polysaccharide pyruvyl transferase WcaK-like protein
MNNDELKKIKILNIAWVGQGDFGDEAMAYALRRFLNLNGISSITYYQHGKYPHYRNQNDSKINFMHKFEGRGLKRYFFDSVLLRKFNCLIVGGGSILHSHENIRWKFEILKKMKKNNRKVFAANLGVSLGPFKSDKDLEICREYLDDVDVSIFRDKWSADLANKISKNKNIYSSLDNTLLLPQICQKEFSEIRNIGPEEDLVGLFFVAKKDWGNFADRVKKYEEIVNNILARGKKIILFNFYVGDIYRDSEVNEILKKKSKNPERIQIHNFTGDIFASIRQMARCQRIVSMRLHGIIFAYLLGIPFISLEYDQKNKNFCESVGYPNELILKFELEKKLDQMYDSMSMLFENKFKANNVLPKDMAIETVSGRFNFLIGEMQKKIL